ncbi:5641_t:CDS:2 [Cetraspora pellucida]|uniref:5641_t:CDS:1 n=1 Tax=Cetraspora pellucida TaxID=1433469 RepID=A0A9N9II66_9GLOM|nr:5641_t:CDS:2 [Cetraspora pellucida]
MIDFESTYLEKFDSLEENYNKAFTIHLLIFENAQALIYDECEYIDLNEIESVNADFFKEFSSTMNNEIDHSWKVNEQNIQVPCIGIHDCPAFFKGHITKESLSGYHACYVCSECFQQNSRHLYERPHYKKFQSCKLGKHQDDASDDLKLIRKWLLSVADSDDHKLQEKLLFQISPALAIFNNETMNKNLSKTKKTKSSSKLIWHTSKDICSTLIIIISEYGLFNLAATLEVKYLEKFKHVVDYRATCCVLELIWVAVGITLCHKIRIRRRNYQKQIANLAAFAPLFPAARKFKYTICSVNLTSEGHYFGFDKALETYSIKFVKQNITGNITNQKTMILKIKATQSKRDCLSMLLSEYIDDIVISQNTRAIKLRKDLLWSLVANLSSTFDYSNPTTHYLFEDVPEFSEEDIENLLSFYETGKLHFQEVLEEDDILISQQTSSPLSSATNSFKHSCHIITEAEKTILAQLFELGDSDTASENKIQKIGQKKELSSTEEITRVFKNKLALNYYT